MASTTPVSIYQSIGSIGDALSSRWQENNLGPWEADIAVRHYAVSSQQGAGAPIYDWHLIEFDGSMSMIVGSDSSWTLAGYGISASPNWDYRPVHMTSVFGLQVPVHDPDPDVRLIDHAPATTIGMSSYSTSMTTTISGSIGFMGEAPTGSVGSSVSTTNSKSRSISDLTIYDASNMSGADDAIWFFEIASGSPLAISDCGMGMSCLYRVPHGRDSFDLNVSWSAYLANGDPSELVSLPSYSNRSPDAVQVMPGFGRGCHPWLQQGKARLSRSKTMTFKAPPPPRSA